MDTEAQELPNFYELETPVTFGSEEIQRLDLAGNGRAMKDFSVKFVDGGVQFEPYRFAELGLRLAGKPRAIVDLMSARDVFGLGLVAMGFIVPGLETGKTVLP